MGRLQFQYGISNVDRFVEFVLTSNGGLTSVDFTSLADLSASGYEKAVKLLKSEVTSLSLKECKNISQDTFKFLFSSFPKLNKLNLTANMQVTDETLSYLCNSCKEITDISLGK